MISIAIIPDGNRRYAKKKGISLPEAYAEACMKIEQTIDWCIETKEINELTIWGLSTENIRRDKDELILLNKLYVENLEKLFNNKKIHKNQVKVRMIGQRDMLQKEVIELAEKIEKETENYKNFTLNVALAYGGREEIITAVKKALESHKPEELTEQMIQENLYINRNPDLIIRTSGVQRLSGYLSWQSAYSELYFSKLFWPEFSKEELMNALEFLKNTKRNFGK